MRIQFIQDIIDLLRGKSQTFKCEDINKHIQISYKPDNPIIGKLFEKYGCKNITVGKSNIQKKCLCDVNADPGVTEQSLVILFDLLNDRNNGNKLLNVGCGLKAQNDFLGELGFDTYGIDIEIEEDSDHFRKHNLNIYNELPFGENTFDYVLCQEIIEHIENPWLLFRKIKRVLKTNGYLIITTPNICCYNSKKAFLNNNVGFSLYFNKDNIWQHINPIPYFEMIHIATYNDFELIKLSGNQEYYMNFESPSYFTEFQKNEVTIVNNDVLHFVFRNKNEEIKEYIPSSTINHKWGESVGFKP